MKEKFLERVSVKEYIPGQLSKQELQDITDIINASPTSTNSHQFSAIIVIDSELKKWITEKNWGQKYINDSLAFIVFVADRTRILEAKSRHHSHPTPNMLVHDYHRAIIDGAIAATYIHDALIVQDYGTTFIGGIPTYGDELSKKLNIPDTAFPFLGLVIGKTKHKNNIKPKLNKVFINKYDEVVSKKEIWDYNEKTKPYFTSIKMDDYISQTADQTNDEGVYKHAFDKAGKYFSEKLKNFK